MVALIPPLIAMFIGLLVLSNKFRLFLLSYAAVTGWYSYNLLGKENLNISEIMMFINLISFFTIFVIFLIFLEKYKNKERKKKIILFFIKYGILYVILTITIRFILIFFFIKEGLTKETWALSGMFLMVVPLVVKLTVYFIFVGIIFKIFGKKNKY